MSKALYTRQGYRCEACATPFKAKTPTNCEVETYVRFLGSLRCPECESSKLTLGLGLSAAENRELIGTGSVSTRASIWLMNGDTGLSSEAIYDHFMGAEKPRTSHPHDIDDLRRCMFLLEHTPEWRDLMPSMSSISKEWAALGTNWHELTMLFNEEAAENKGRYPRTYALLTRLIR